MNHKSLRLVAVVGAFVASACIASSAAAQCCGWGGGWSGGWGTTAYYAPTYQTYDTGWYPGYWWNRATARLWGSPTTYVAAYSPGCTTCGTSSWWPSSSCSTCASYAPSSCATCASPCSSCSTCTAGYSPCSSCSTCSSSYVTSYAPSCGCTTCGASCPSNCGCAGCSNGSTVVQASYQQPSGCNCGTQGSQPSTYVSPSAAPAPQPTPAAAPANGAGQTSPSTSSPEPKPNYDVNRPATEANPPANGAQPSPGSETEDKVDPYEVKKPESGAYFEAPQLFNPKDHTARSTSIAPVRTAVYHQPASYRAASTAPRGPITAEQARRDAIGWTSGTN